MTLLRHRRNNIAAISAAGNLQPAGSYTVTGYKPGAMISSSTSTITLTVYAGHGFTGSGAEKAVLFRPGTGIVAASFVTVSSLTGNVTLNISGSVTAVAGDYVINLGADTGTSSPLYDGSPLTIYSDPGTTSVTQARVTADSGGEYLYWHKENLIWELIKNASGTPTDLCIFDTQEAVELLSTTTVSFAADQDTTLYTVPGGRRCVLVRAVIVAGADAGATTTMSIGADGAETDFVGAQTLSNLDAANDAVIIMPVPNATPVKIKSYASGTVIQARVATNSGGATNTVYLFGFLY